MCAEYAVSVTLRSYVKKFDEIEDPYLAERVRDIYDIEKKVVKEFVRGGQGGPEPFDERCYSGSA